MRTARRLLATACALGAAATFVSSRSGWPSPVLFPLGLLVLSAALLWRRDLGSQLLARAIWWSNLLLGTLIAISTTLGSERLLGGGITLGAGLALLILGRLGVDDADRAGSFVPVALRGTLTASLVMALADAQTLLLFGGIALHDATEGSGEIALPAGVLLVGAGVLLVAAGWGLFRLRGWGVLASVLGNLVLLGVVIVNVNNLPRPLRLGWGATACVQLILMARLLVALRTGATASPRRLPASTAWLSTLVILALTLTGLACATLDFQLIGVR